MIDLDAVIAAEAKGDPIEVKVGRRKFKIRSEMPWETSVLFGENNLREAIASIVAEGDPDEFVKAFLADGPNMERIGARLGGLYAAGESSASPRSSTSGGTRSRPTSKRTTTSTSDAA